MPPNARSWCGVGGTPSGNTGNPVFAVAADASGTGEVVIATNAASGVSNTFDGFTTGSAFADMPLITAQTFYYKSVAATQAVRIDINAYTF